MSSVEYNRKLDAASERTCEILHKKYNTKLLGTGGGVKGDMLFMALRVQVSEKYTIEQARKIIIDMVDVFVAELNKDESLKEYSKYKFPFTEKNIDIIISIDSNQNRKDRLEPGELCAIFCDEGKLYYDKYISRNRDEEILRESYEEAKSKI